jgi:hypothetical protein
MRIAAPDMPSRETHENSAGAETLLARQERPIARFCL